MKIIKKLFGQKETSEASTQITALTGNAKSRCEQLKNSDDIHLLLTAYQTEDDEVVIDCADMRLREVLVHTKDKDHLIAIDSVPLSLKTLKTLAATAKSPQLRRSSLDKLHDDQSLTEVIAHTDDWQIKTAAIEQLKDMDTLRSLQKQFKGKQKVGYRSVKNRLAVLRQREGDIALLSQSMNLLEAAIEEHSLTALQVEQITQQWQEVKDFLPTQKRQAFAEKLTQGQAISQHNEQAKETRQHLLDELDRLRQQLNTDSYHDEKSAFKQEISDLKKLWVQLPEWQSRESEAMEIRFEQAVSYINEQSEHHFNEQYSSHSQQHLLDMCRQRLANNTFVTKEIIANKKQRWQALPPLQDSELQNRYQDEFDALIEQLQNRSQQQIAERHNNDEQVPLLLEELDTLIENGEVKSATAVQEDIRGRLRSSVGLSQAVHQQVSGTFKRLEGRLHELVEWRQFGNEQAREHLIESMQALCDNKDMDIEEKAEQIKTLQKEWKDIKGHAPDDLWAKFKTLGDEAWQPCADYFKTARETSETHLQERLQFLKETTDHLNSINSEQVNWAMVIGAHQLFEKQWQSYPELPGLDYRKARKAYRKVTKLWDKHFDAERSRELQRREQAIETVKQLADSEDLDAAVEQTKALQQTWTPSIALKKPSEEQALCEQFQQACNNVFERQQEQQEQQEQEQQEQEQQEQEQQEQQEQEQQEQQEQEQAVSEQQSADKTQSDDTSQQVDKSDKSDKSDKADNSEQYEQQLTTLKSQDMLCIQLETELRNSVRLKQIEQTWEKLTPPLSDGQSEMNERFQQALQAQKSGELIIAKEEAVTRAKEICLILELSADLPSPDEDKTIREQMHTANTEASANGDNAFEHHATATGLYQLNIQWLSLPKSGLNETNGMSLLNWRARFDTAMQKNLANLPS